MKITSVSPYAMKGNIICLLIAVMLTACSPRIIIQRDTVTTTKEVIKEIVRDTTIYITLPQDSVAVSTFDTTSVLSTKIARSMARVSQGILQHTLTNRTDYKPEIVVKYKDREVVRDSIVYINVETPVEVEKKLSWLQRLFIVCGKAALLLLVIVGPAVIVACVMKK